MMFDNRRLLFYDLDTRSTFSVSKEQWLDAKEEFERQLSIFTVPDRKRIYTNPYFSIKTETDTHYRWLFREDQDYCEEHVRGIR